MYSGQFVYCGKRATLSIGNVLPPVSLHNCRSVPYPTTNCASNLTTQHKIVHPAIEATALTEWFSCPHCATPRWRSLPTP
uniref:Uncharacterized protein n=1 Tax=Physcomitrium patens TaxID=3218 RepID=A0A2K1KUA8_PHYPA|nr:hypothetical protein PHYPA_004330 [Physcomitrium patens]